MKIEEFAVVIDFLPRGKSTGYKAEPLAQVIGETYFTLLEVIPKPGVELKAGERVYIGKDNRDKIDFIKRRISFKELTSNSVAEIEKTIEKVVMDNEKNFVEFFNTSNPITIKRHQLELLPGLGKKHMFEILGQREKKPFESFEDIKKRIHLMPDVVKTIVKRVMDELEDEEDKHFLFVRPPSPPKPQFGQREFRR